MPAKNCSIDFSSDILLLMIRSSSSLIKHISVQKRLVSISLLVIGLTIIFIAIVKLSNNKQNFQEAGIVPEFETYDSNSNAKVASDNKPSPTKPSNWAEMSAPTEEKYNPQKFGISIPQLENKNIEKIESKYKGALITSRYATINDINIATWTIDKQEGTEKIDLPQLSNKFLTDANISHNYYDFPILDGYEWWFVVVDEKFISSRLPINTTQDKIHTTRNGVKMYRKLSSCPESICGVGYEFHIVTENGQRQLFVTMRKAVDYLNISEEELNQRIEAAFRDLEEFVNKLSLHQS